MIRYREMLMALGITLSIPLASEAQSHGGAEWDLWSNLHRIRSEIQKLQIQGRARAEAEYAEGWAEVECFGLIPGEGLLVETGLYLRKRGCVIHNLEGVESDAYNERIRELIAQQGPPEKARGLKDRYDQTRKLLESKQDVIWTPLVWSKIGTEPVSVKFGEYDVFPEVVPMERDVPKHYRRVRIVRDNATIATAGVESEWDSFVAFEPLLDVLIVKTSARVDFLTVIDLQHRRIMWQEPGPVERVLYIMELRHPDARRNPPD